MLEKSLKKKNIIFILFFDKSRFHNKDLYEILNEEKVLLYSSFYSKLIGKRFGEYDQFLRLNKKNFFQNIIINLIKKIRKKKTKIFNINELYDYSYKNYIKNNNNKNILQKTNQWLDSYFEYVKKKNFLKINFKHPKLKKFLKDKPKKRSLCLYLRKKSFVNDETKNYNLYINLINFFYKKNFIIYLTGEYEEFIEKNFSIQKKILTPEFNGKNDSTLNLIMQVTSDYFVGPSGGGAWFAMYKKKAIIFGQEECYERPNVKSYKYKLYYKNKLISRKSKFYKILKQKMIEDDQMGHPGYLKKKGIKIKNIDNNIILNYAKKNFI